MSLAPNSADELPRPQNRRGVTLAVAVALLAAAGFAANTYAHRQPSAKSTPAPMLAAPAPRLVTAQVESGATDSATLAGTLEAHRTVVVSAEIPARLLQRPVERGERVTQGALLAAFDDRNARATLEDARAGLAAATAAVRQAEAGYAQAQTETQSAIAAARAGVSQATAGERKARSFTRTQELAQAQAGLSAAQTDERLAKIERDRFALLVKEGAVAQDTLDRAQAALDAAAARTRAARETVSLATEGARKEDIAGAAAQVAAARANLAAANSRPTRLEALRAQIAAARAGQEKAAADVANAETQLSKYRIAAPITGRVVDTRLERGEMAAPGVPVVILADVRDLRAVFAVPEAGRAFLSAGRRVTITSDAVPGRSFAARVVTPGYTADPKTRAFRVELAVDNRGERLLPNMTARLSVPTGTAARRVTVPVSAVATDETTGAPYVLAEANGNLSRRPVTLGAPAQNGGVVVLSGLRGGEQIAADPARVGDGRSIQ